jgi:hypothetical protein
MTYPPPIKHSPLNDNIVLTIGFVAAILKLLLLPAVAVYLIWFL